MNQLTKDIINSVKEISAAEGLTTQEVTGILQLQESIRIGKKLDECFLYIKGIDEGVEEANYLLESVMDEASNMKHNLRIGKQ